MDIIEYLRATVRGLPLREEYKLDILVELSRLTQKMQQLHSEIERKNRELKAIRKMHEVEPIMPFYDELPKSYISLRDDRYDLKLAVRGLVERHPERPAVALSIREYGFSKNISTQVWIDEISLICAVDRKALINHVLNTMAEQVNKLFDKETNGV